MNMIALIVGGLVTWRISHMLVKESGPLAIFARLRAHLAFKQKRIGGLFDMFSCVACLSMYVAALTSLWLAESVFELVLYTLSFSAVATLLEAYFTKRA